jgi:cytochrome c-type biogenesis protein
VTVAIGRSAALLAAVAVLAVPLVGCGGAEDPGSGGDAEVVEYGAVEFDSGVSVDVEGLRGRPVLLSSWASWCPPCERELPELERLHRERGDELSVVVVNVDEEEVSHGDLAATVARHDLTMPIWRDTTGAFADTFRGVGFPIHALLDTDGRLAATWIGVIDPDTDDFLDAVDRAGRS